MVYSDKSTLVPAAVQLALVDTESYQAAAVSPVVMLSETVPRRARVRSTQPRWLQYNAQDATKIAWIQAICIGPPPGSSKVYIRGLCRVQLDVSSELVEPACPTSFAELPPF